jgi:hypothetical protein
MRKKRYFSILFDFFLEWKTSKKKLKYYFFLTLSIHLEAPICSKRGAMLLGLSCDDVLSHVEWVEDI